MKKNDRNHEKKISDDFPSGGGLFNAKNVKKSQKSKKGKYLGNYWKILCFDHIIQKADKISEIKKKFIKIGWTVWILEHFEVEKACREAKNWILKRPYVENRQKFQKTQNSPFFYFFM